MAARTGVLQTALERVVYNESRGNPYVGMDRSNYTAGIAQVSRAVWATFSKLPYNNASDPKQYENNIMVAAQYLKQNYKRFGNWTDAMRAYNLGPTALTEYYQGRRRLPLITQKYVQGFKQ